MAVRQTTDFPAGGILTDTMLDNEFNEIFTNITDTNIAAGANIAISKTTLGTYTAPAAYSSSVTGFSGTPTQSVKLMQIGKLGIISAQISGTSNNSSFTFTIPYTADGQTNSTARVMDNGTWKTAGTIEIITNTSTVNVYIDSSGSGFTASGTKAVQVTFVMIVA